jgi:hypothetical protein
MTRCPFSHFVHHTIKTLVKKNLHYDRLPDSEQQPPAANGARIICFAVNLAKSSLRQDKIPKKGKALKANEGFLYFVHYPTKNNMQFLEETGCAQQLAPPSDSGKPVV